ncbi:phosphatidylserine decarboxylase [Ranunculus cassubicifolius]
MLGALHVRRILEDRKLEDARVKGIELEFSPDARAGLYKLLPLRSISRFWGFVTSVEYPIWLRPYVYKAWARAFHSNLEEAALPLNQYASLRDFFARSLKEGSRPIDHDPHSLVSPVDGTILRVGELKSGAMIEQIKGASYSAAALLGASSFPSIVQDDAHGDDVESENTTNDASKKSWWRISFASPKVRDPTPARSMKGVFYCVIYLQPGDYHRVHSPVDWQILIRRHFPGRLYPVYERARRTVKNLYVENERVVLEGKWDQGYMALAAVGATNIGSIELFIEPELKTNRPMKLLQLEPPRERVYEPQGVALKKGQEVAAFNMGSTVVLIFQAPVSKPSDSASSSSNFKFCVNRGEKIRMGQALGNWKST